MPFKPPPNDIPVSSLMESLLDSDIQQKNNALYQTIFGLIRISESFQDEINNRFKADSKLPSAQIEGTIPYQQGGVKTGYYLPTLTNIANASDVSGGNYYTTWWRMGQIVFVSGKVSFTPDAGAPGAEVLTQIEINPPFGSLFAHTEQASGVIGVNPFTGTVGAPGVCWANPATLNVTLEFWSPFAVSCDLRFMFSYEYIPLNS